MFEGAMLGVAIYAGVAGWPWWSAPLLGLLTGLGSLLRKSRPQPEAMVVIVFGWAGLLAVVYLFANTLFRAV